YTHSDARTDAAVMVRAFGATMNNAVDSGSVSNIKSVRTPSANGSTAQSSEIRSCTNRNTISIVVRKARPSGVEKRGRSNTPKNHVARSSKHAYKAPTRVITAA